MRYSKELRNKQVIEIPYGKAAQLMDLDKNFKKHL
jgi:hypothetical protein